MVLDSFLQKYIFHSSSRTTVHFGNTTKGVSLKQLQGRGKQWDEIALVSYPFFCLGFFFSVVLFFAFFFSFIFFFEKGYSNATVPRFGRWLLDAGCIQGQAWRWVMFLRFTIYGEEYCLDSRAVCLGSMFGILDVRVLSSSEYNRTVCATIDYAACIPELMMPSCQYPSS